MRIKDDSLRLKGFPKLINNMVMFVLFPFRKPYIIIPLLIMAYLVPTFIGAKPSEVHLWYMNKIKAIYSDVETKVADKAKSILPDTSAPLRPQMGGSIIPEKAIERVVDMPQQKVRRKMFEKAKSDPTTVDILKQREQVDKQAMQKASTAGTTKKKLALVYVNETKEISGRVTVVNANEIEINGQALFLYGVYVDPNTQKGIEAKVFLTQTIGTEVVKCNIEAYTYQGVATGICFINSINLNQLLVDKGLTKNVAL